MYVVTLLNGEVIGTTTKALVRHLERVADVESIVFVENLDRAEAMIDYTFE